jgi:hypothetical protein
VTRPVGESESEEPVLVDRKGKRKVVQPAKRVKVEKVEKKPRQKAEKPKAGGSKVKAKRAAPKSTPMVADTSEGEQEEMVVDEESAEEEPKPKRARVTASQSLIPFF